ncbi:unnamed protein product [Rotaria sp. Silwood1]|nr:unnamed protein product [Rotaria sp. Silwood1]
MTPKLDAEWTDFENAATYKFARYLVEEKYRSHIKNNMGLFSAPSKNEVALQIQKEMQNSINELQTQIKQLIIDMKLMKQTKECMEKSE